MPDKAPAPEPETVAVVAVGDIAALAGDLAGFAGEGTLIVLLPAPPTPEPVGNLARLLDAAAVSGRQPRPSRYWPEGPLRAGIVSEKTWATVPTAQGAVRFREALLPRRILGGESVVVASVGGPFSTSPCGLLASFAHPRQRVALRLAGDPAPAAELAAAIPLRAALLAGAVDGLPVATACSTLLASQLLWRALQPRRPGSEAPGPWEQPEVQRLTSLDLRPRLPGELGIVLHGAGPEAAAMARMLQDQLGDVSLHETRR